MRQFRKRRLVRRSAGLKSRFRSQLTLAAAVIFLGAAAQAVEVGEQAPDFTLPGSDGQTYSLADLRGQHVVIAFFPKAFTGG